MQAAKNLRHLVFKIRHKETVNFKQSWRFTRNRTTFPLMHILFLFEYYTLYKLCIYKKLFHNSNCNLKRIQFKTLRFKINDI